MTRDSDGTATAAANGDLPVPKDCQARAEGIAQIPSPFSKGSPMTGNIIAVSQSERSKA